MTAVTRASCAVLEGIGATTVALLTGCSLRAPFLAGNLTVRRVGYLTGNSNSPQNTDPDNAAFRQSLCDLGYVEGQNLTIEARYADFNNDLLPDLAAGLLADGVEVIVTSAGPAAVVAKRASQAVPIVFMEVNDPGGLGLVPNLAHPGGNVTGVSTLSGGISSASALNSCVNCCRTSTTSRSSGTPRILGWSQRIVTCSPRPAREV
jgi:hypothetical protein